MWEISEWKLDQFSPLLSGWRPFLTTFFSASPFSHSYPPAISLCLTSKSLLSSLPAKRAVVGIARRAASSTARHGLFPFPTNPALCKKAQVLYITVLWKALTIVFVFVQWSACLMGKFLLSFHIELSCPSSVKPFPSYSIWVSSWRQLLHFCISVISLKLGLCISPESRTIPVSTVFFIPSSIWCREGGQKVRFL